MQTGANVSESATMRLEEMNHWCNQMQKCQLLFVSKNRAHVAGILTCASSKSKNLGNTAPAVELPFGQALYIRYKDHRCCQFCYREANREEVFKFQSVQLKLHTTATMH